MAKSYRGMGSNEDIDSDRLLDVIHGNGKTKEIGGLMGFVLRPFKDSATYANKLFEKELQRITKLGREQEKEMMANRILEKAKEGYLKKRDKELELKIEANKKTLKALEDEQKRADDAFKFSQEVKKEELKAIKRSIAEAKKAGRDASQLEAQAKAKQSEIDKEARDKSGADSTRKFKIAKTNQALAANQKLDEDAFNTYLQNTGHRKHLESLVGKHEVDKFIQDKQDRDVLDPQKAQEAVILARMQRENILEANKAIDEGRIDAKSAGGGRLSSLDFDDDSDYSEIRRGKVTPKPTPVAPTTKAQAQQDALGALDPYSGGNAITASANSMQGNLARDLRDEDIAHRTERETLTDEYRKMVKENLEEQTYQLKTINENQHAIYELMQQGGGSGGGGGLGLADMMMGMIGAKGAGGLLSKGFNLVKGVGSKVALPLALASSVFTGAKSGMDTDAISAYTGKDPSEVGILDRLQYGGAGLLSGLTGGIVGTDTIANAGEAIGNFLFGKSDATVAREARLKEQQDLAELDAMLASREATVATSGGSSIHNQILDKMGVEAQPQAQGQELAELNAGTGGNMSSQVSNVTNNTTNVIPENPKFRISDSATLALSAQGL